MNYNWTIEKDEKNKTITLHLELDLQKHRINKPTDPAVKVNSAEAAKYLCNQGIRAGKLLKNATVTNRSPRHNKGTWVFELKSAPVEKIKRATTRKSTKTTRKSTKTQENTEKEV
mgnify:CR=1 FL=1